MWWLLEQAWQGLRVGLWGGVAPQERCTAAAAAAAAAEQLLALHASLDAAKKRLTALERSRATLLSAQGASTLVVQGSLRVRGPDGRFLILGEQPGDGFGPGGAKIA
jgi:hypothetical protein